MIKASTRDSEGDKTVCSGICCGGYVTADNQVAISNYLVHVPSQNDVILEIGVEEKLNERGNCGDSDDDGDYARNFGNTLREFKLERSRVLLRDDEIYQPDEGDMKYVLLRVWDTMEPDEVKFPKAPYDWVYPAPEK